MAKLFVPDMGNPNSMYGRARAYILKEEHYDLAFSLLWGASSREKESAAISYVKGQMYENGIGTATDKKTAYRCYLNAVDAAKHRLNGNLPLSDEHISGAYFRMAEMLYQGEGVKQDRASAVAFFKEAARKGRSAHAAHNAGMMYAKGEGIPVDMKAALQMFEMAAGFGKGEASGLGALNAGVICLQEHPGLKQDYEKAVFWFGRALEMGCKQANRYMAMCCANGQGVPQDMDKAEQYAILAKQSGDPVADELLHKIRSKKGAEREEDLASAKLPDRLGHALAMGDYFYVRLFAERYALAGNCDACVMLAIAYASSDGDEDAPVDYDKAIYWARKAAENGMDKDKAEVLMSKILTAKREEREFFDI